MQTTRRRFLGSAAALPLAGRATLGLSLATGGRVGAQTAGSSGDDYKAIVCLYMSGGNDYANTVVPYDDASYASYLQYRADLAYQKNALLIGPVGQGRSILNTSGSVMGGIPTLAQSVLDPRDEANNPVPARQLDGTARQFALAPPLSALLPMFNNEQAANRKLAILLNAGPLIEPVPRVAPGMHQQIRTTGPLGPVPKPLFAHDYQTSYWMTSHGIDQAIDGWGGRALANLQYMNEQPTFTSISLSTNTPFLTGQEVFQYQVAPAGPDRFGPLRNAVFGSTLAASALEQIVTASGNGLFENAHTAVVRRAIEAGDVLAAGIEPATGNPQSQQVFDLLRTKYKDVLGYAGYPTVGYGLGAQLAMVARIIAARGATGARRQVFYVAIHGFDHHSDMVRNHPGLLKQVGDSMAAFYNLTQDMGCADKVTTFTASDFGRTFVSNGDGTDHGWGSMHFVLGGAVKGGRFYGPAPKFGHETEDDYGQGRLVPTTAVDQIASTLALWMGVPDEALASVAPHIDNFRSNPLAPAGVDLGFLTQPPSGT